MAGEEKSGAMRGLLYLAKDETIAGMDQTAKEGNGVTGDLCHPAKDETIAAMRRVAKEGRVTRDSRALATAGTIAEVVRAAT